MKVVRTVRDVRDALTGESSVGLVPTMGAFHAGHRALFDAARAENEVVVVSLFVNPAQFDDAADLAAYPRDEERDLRLAEEAGVDVVFAPVVQEMYPVGFQTWVDVEEAAAKDWAGGVYQQGHLYMFPAQATGRFPYSLIEYPSLTGTYLPPVQPEVSGLIASTDSHAAAHPRMEVHISKGRVSEIKGAIKP